MDTNQRSDALTAQKVDVALILQEMLSTEEAEAFLQRNRVVSEVIERVLREGVYREAGSTRTVASSG